MAILRGIPRRQRGPSLRGRVMVDAVRGVLRVRKWPKKPPRPLPAAQAWWLDWFTQANRLAKYADGMSRARAIEMTKGSGMYPRDVLLKAMAGRLYFWTTPDGWKWYSMAAIGDISESLDVLAQTVGDVLVRATDRWRAPPAGNAGDVLTNAGPGFPPGWVAAAPAAGVLSTVVYASGTQSIATGATVPIVFDTTLYDDAGLHDPALNPSRFTAPAGVVRMRLTVNVRWDTNTTGFRDIYVKKNGVSLTPWPIDRLTGLGAGEHYHQCVSYDVPMTPTDYLEGMVFQNSGGNRLIGPSPFLWAHCLLNP